jgi:hypothetical protein
LDDVSVKIYPYRNVFHSLNSLFLKNENSEKENLNKYIDIINTNLSVLIEALKKYIESLKHSNMISESNLYSAEEIKGGSINNYSENSYLDMYNNLNDLSLLDVSSDEFSENSDDNLNPYEINVGMDN